MSDEIDWINNPPHYTQNVLEPIELVELLSPTMLYLYGVGSALKYLIRAGLKGPALLDYQKALWFLELIHSREVLADEVFTSLPPDLIPKCFPLVPAGVHAVLDLIAYNDIESAITSLALVIEDAEQAD